MIWQEIAWFSDLLRLERQKSWYFYKTYLHSKYLSHPSGSGGKASAHNVGRPRFENPGFFSPGKENGNPLQYSCLENSMDGGAWWATSMGSQRVGHDWATSLSLVLFKKNNCTNIFGPLVMLKIITKVSLQNNILSYTWIIPPSIIILELLHCKSKDYSNCPI